MAIKIRFQCCFCGGTIENTSSSLKLLIKSNHSKIKASQELYAHSTCLERCLHKSAPLYLTSLIEDTDMENQDYK